MTGRVHRPTVLVRIDGTDYVSLLDTGACVSLLRRRAYDQLRNPFPLGPCPNQVTALDGKRLPDLGCGYLWVPLFNIYVLFYIVEELEFDLLLGHEALQQSSAIIDCCRKTITIKGNTLPFENVRLNSPDNEQSNNVTMVTMSQSNTQCQKSTRDFQCQTTITNDEKETLTTGQTSAQKSKRKQNKTQFRLTQPIKQTDEVQASETKDDLSYSRQTDDIQKTGYQAIDDVIQSYSDVFRTGDQPLGNCSINPIRIETTRIEPIPSVLAAGIDQNDPNDEDDLAHDIFEISVDIPVSIDGLDMEAIKTEQIDEYEDLRLLAEQEDSDYVLLNDILYSVRKPPLNAEIKERLVLPSIYHEQVIARAHKEVGHQGIAKTMLHILEAYKWPKMKETIKEYIRTCPKCLAYSRKPIYTPMGEMPVPELPNQLISMDLIGPLPETEKGNKYALTIIDHCTGWAEVFPLRNKTNKAVWDAFADLYLPRHGIPAIILTDNGQEFCAERFREYLQQLNIKHRRITPYHPQANGKIERFNKTFKEMITKSIDNNPATWENKISDVLLAHHISVSSVTGHTPFYLTYGRHPRTPLPTLLPQEGEHYLQHRFGNRLDNLTEALIQARQNTLNSRKHNRERLQKRSNVNDLRVGDTVLIKAENRATFTSRWDPKYVIINARPPVYTVRNEQTGKTKTLNREKLKIVDPHIEWDEVPPRPRARAVRQPGVILDNNRNNRQHPPEQAEQHPEQANMLRQQDAQNEQQIVIAQVEPINYPDPDTENIQQNINIQPIVADIQHDRMDDANDSAIENVANESTSTIDDSDISDLAPNLEVPADLTNMETDLGGPDNQNTSQGKRLREDTSSSEPASDEDNVFLGTDGVLYQPGTSRSTTGYKRRLRRRVQPVDYYGYN